MKLFFGTAAALVCCAPLVLIGCSVQETKPPPPPAKSGGAAASADAQSPSSATPPDADKSESTSASSDQETSQAMVKTSSFGKTQEGEDVTLFTCTNKNGLVLKMIDYGAIVVSIETPDRNGKRENITLGFPSLDGYLQRHPYFGSTIGRYGNRIAKGKFKIGDEEYTLAVNNGPNHLHGGIKGFDAVMWKGQPATVNGGVAIVFTYTSKDGEEGYPGNLDVDVTYTLTDNDELRIDYKAKTDKPTVINLTNHNYWNLGGQKAGPVLSHHLMLEADKYVPVDENSIPTGELAEVEGTAFDFRQAHAIGDGIDEAKKQYPDQKGYDHTWVVNGNAGELRLAARVKDPQSGRTMEIHTTEPGVQFYCGNFLDGSEKGNGFKQHEALCLETQHFPDSPNQPSFPSTLLEPGDLYNSTTIHKFGVEAEGE